MGNPLSASPEVPLKTQASRKGVKFKVSQQPLLEAEHPQVLPSSSEHRPDPVVQPSSVASVVNGWTSHPTPVAHREVLLEENFGPLPTTYHRDSLF